MSQNLRGKTALITGAAQRIGRETALTLADQGINIVIHFHRSDTESCQLAEKLQQKGVIYVDGGRHLHEYTNGSHPH